MMTESSGPTLHRRRLGHALRFLRERAGLTGKQVGDAVERSSSWISRVESGRVGLRVRDLRELCEVYGLTDQARLAELEALAREGKQRGWWSQFGDTIPEAYGLYIGLENDAQSLLIFSNTVVPGLLQAESYMRALLRTHIPPTYPLHDSRARESRIQVRLRRQQLLRRNPPPTIKAVLDQSVLHRNYGGREVLREQLQFLKELARSEFLEIQVLPFTRAGRANLTNSFTILGFPDGLRVVYIEAAASNLFFQEESEVRIYQEIIDNLTGVALSTDESISLIDEEIGKLG